MQAPPRVIMGTPGPCSRRRTGRQKAKSRGSCFIDPSSASQSPSVIAAHVREGGGSWCHHLSPTWSRAAIGLPAWRTSLLACCAGLASLWVTCRRSPCCARRGGAPGSLILAIPCFLKGFARCCKPFATRRRPARLAGSSRGQRCSRGCATACGSTRNSGATRRSPPCRCGSR